jgi:hypothetical protein
MKSTVNLLGRWRLALYENRDAFEILSYIYKNLSADPQEIADALGTPKARIANAVWELYSAGLIYTKSGQFLFASEKATALMELEEMLDLSLESLSKELLLETDDKRPPQSWLRATDDYADKRDRLYKLQVARCMDFTLGTARKSVWERVFSLLFDGKAKAEVVTTNYDTLLEASLHKSPNFDELERLLKVPRTPKNQESLEVLDRSVIFLLVYWVSNPHPNLSAKYGDNSEKCADIFTSWSSDRYAYHADSVASLLNRCQFQRTFTADELVRERILAETRGVREQPADSEQTTKLTPYDRIIKLLLKDSSDKGESADK